jgi:hypothetical protein
MADAVKRHTEELEAAVEERTHDLQIKNVELSKALSEVRTLRGLLPICSYCKKIRDDDGDWLVLEAYIGQRSEAKFSHGLCPGCFEREFSDVDPSER